MVPGRTNRQCRQIWLLALEPTIDRTTARYKGKWTPEEDAKLTDVVTDYGDSNWVRVAAMVPGRTNNQCRRKRPWSHGHSC
jgi:myb proto-oncogene protein